MATVLHKTHLKNNPASSAKSHSEWQLDIMLAMLSFVTDLTLPFLTALGHCLCHQEPEC